VPHSPEAATFPTGKMSSAKVIAVLADNFIGYHKAMVIKAKPLAALWATRFTQPIPEAVNQRCSKYVCEHKGFHYHVVLSLLFSANITIILTTLAL